MIPAANRAQQWRSATTNTFGKAVASAAPVVLGLGLAAVPAHADVAPVDVDEVLAVANVSRAQYGAAPLVWDPNLASGAQEWAGNCRFVHSGGGSAYGENLFAYAGRRTASFADAQDRWMAEAADYDYGDPGFATNTGHFTQAVWKSTTAIAVGVAECPAGSLFAGYGNPQTLIVVRYSPPGNFAGQYTANVGRPQ